MAFRQATACSHTLQGRPTRLGASAQPSRAVLCPPALRCRRLALQQRRRGRAPAPRVTAALPAVAAVAAPAIAAVSKALLMGVAASWVSSGQVWVPRDGAIGCTSARHRPPLSGGMPASRACFPPGGPRPAPFPCCCRLKVMDCWHALQHALQFAAHEPNALTQCPSAAGLLRRLLPLACAALQRVHTSFSLPPV